MKFGRNLQEQLYPEWRFYYLDYDGLKQMIKERTSKGTFFEEKDEAFFVDTLEKEIQKVFDFRDMKGGELTRHVQYCENVVGGLASTDKEALKQIEDEISRITAELSQLAAFTRLNYTGFMKILKKHDKHTEFMLRPMFMLRLNSKPLYLENLDSLVYRLSKLYDRIRRGPVDASGRQLVDGQEEGESQVFVRKTTKYWVHPDNVTEVKCIILKQLPVLVFPKEERKIDPAVSSVYLDNENLELYVGRLEKTEGAEAIRIRWYGKMETDDVFVERKVHREDWTGEISYKARFQIKAKHLNEYMKGIFTTEDLERKLRKHDGRSEEEIQRIVALASEIQQTIIKRRLKPTIRTFYNRTAFQLPADSRVRISLDTELAMIREDGKERSGSNWRRIDINADYPFYSLLETDICRFPYAILEVKLQTQAGQDPPRWVQNLVDSHLVEEVPKFSKFIHGCATLFSNKVPLLPYWLPQMNKDIRKPPPSTAEELEDGDGAADFGSKSPRDQERADLAVQVATSPTSITSTAVTENVNGKDRADYLVIPVEDGTREGNEKEPLLPNHGTGLLFPHKSGGWSWWPFGRRRQGGDDSQVIGASRDGSESIGGKKPIAIPVRVEPKVFFANERTFLSWIHFAIFLGGISTALVGLGNRKARVSGLLFGAVSILFTGYALYLYQWRAAKIRQRDPGPYDDRLGPSVVVFVFLAAMVANTIFSIIEQE